MKPTHAFALLVVALLLVVLVGCGGFDKISEADVDAQQKATAQKLATRIYEGCNTGIHEPLRDDEAIKEMQVAFSPDKMTSTCASIAKQFGAYQSMDYAETWKGKTGPLRVYRFKGHFANTTETPEIRVVMDGAKLSGFWIRPWADALR